jgi:hypothetical protein
VPPPPRLVGAVPRGSPPVVAAVVPDAVPGAVVPDAVVLPTAAVLEVLETALDAGCVAAPAAVVADAPPAAVACALGALVAVLPPQALRRSGTLITSTESFPSG